MPKQKKSWDKGAAAETAAGVGIAGYGPNAIYHAENAVMRHRAGQVDQKLQAHNANVPQKPQPTPSPDGNFKPVPKDVKAQYITDIKSHTKTARALEGAKKAALKPHIYPKQTKLWLGATAVGVPMAWHGMRRQVNRNKQSFEKKRTNAEKDVDNATMGAVGSYGLYQGGAIVGSKPYTNHAARKIAADPALKAKMDAHREKALGDKNAKIVAGDKSLRNKFFHNYPTDVPAGKFKRAVSWTHTGPTGVAATAGVMAGAGYGAMKYGQHRRKQQEGFAKLMGQTQINHRKRASAIITRGTSAAGLAALGVLGAGAVAPKIAGTGKIVRLTPEVAEAFKHSTAAKATTATVVSGGVASANGFNNAAVQSAEAKQRKRNTVMAKNDATGFDPGYVFGSTTEINKYFDAEQDRMKRANAYATGTDVLAGAAGMGAIHQGAKALKSLKDTNVQTWAGRRPKIVANAGPVKAAAKHGGRAGLLAAGTAGAVVAGKKIRQKKSTGDWQPYAKSATSAFGITHD